MKRDSIKILLTGHNLNKINKYINIKNSTIISKNFFSEALKEIRKSTPDVVILSILTAEKKTLELIDTLLKLNSELLIIIVSEIQNNEKHLQFISAGAEDYVNLKNLSELSEKIKFSLARRNNIIHTLCKNSHEKYNLINNNIKDVIWIMSPELKFIYLSPSVMNLRGYSVEEIMQQKFEQLFAPESLKLVKSIIKDFSTNLKNGIKIKESYRVEIEQPHKNGSLIPVEIVVNPTYDEYENFKYFLGISRDISERKKIEAELIKAKDEYQLIVENQNDLILKLDPEFNIIFASPQYCSTFNMKEEDLIGKQFTPLIHPEDMDSALEAMSKILKPPYKTIHSERMLTSKGWIWFEWSDNAVIDKKGMIKEIISVGRNIQQQKLNEEKIIQSERKFSNLLKNLPGMVYSCQNVRNWTMEFVSNGCLELTGYSPEELQKDNVVSYNDLIHPDDRDYVWKAVQNSIEKQENFELKYRIITKQGKEKWVWERGAYSYKTDNNKELLEGFIFDITDKVDSENALAESERQFRFISENADDLIYIYEFTPEPRFKYVSPSATRITGYTPEEHYADPNLGYKLIHPDDVHLLQEVSNGEFSYQPIVLRWKKKDGTIIWTEQRNVPLYDDSGTLIAIQGIARDITERKLAEEKIRESEEKYRRVVENIHESIILEDIDGNLVFANEEFYHMFGFDKEKDTQLNLKDYTAPESLKDILNRHNRRIQGYNELTEFEYLGLKKDGTKIWVEARVKLIKENDKIIGTLSFERDITEFKKMQDKLVANEEKYRLIFSTVNDALIFMDLKGKIIDCNSKTAELYGGDINELIGTQFNELGIIPKDLSKKMIKAFEEALLRKEFRLDFTFINKKGIEYTLDCSTRRIESHEKLVGLVIICHDITKRRQMEENLRKRNEFIQTVLDNLPIGVALNSIYDSKASYMNKKFQEIYGWSKEELNDVNLFFEKVYPDEKYRKEIIEKIMSDIASKNPTRMHWEGIEVTTKNGSKKIVNAVNIPLFDQDTMVSTVMDVTKEKLFERSLIANESKLKSIFKVAPIGIGLVSNRIFLDVNDTLCYMVGYDKNELIGKSSRILYPSDEDYEFVGKEKYEQINSKGIGIVETRFKTKSGKILNILLSSTPLNPENLDEGVTFTAMDITLWKQFENELKKNEEKYRNLFNSIQDAIVVTDKNRKIIDCNSAFSQIFGYSLDEIIGNNTLFLYDEVKQFWDMGELINKSIKSDKSFNKVNNYKTKNNKVFTGDTNIFFLKDSSDNISGYIGIIRDITEQIAIENELQGQQERLNIIIDHSNELFYMHDIEHNILYVSPHSEKMLGYTPNELKVNWTTKVTTNPINQNGYEKTMAAIETGLRQKPYLLEVTRKDGINIIVEVDESPIKDEDGIVIGIAGALRDITNKYYQDIQMKNLASFVELNPYPTISFNSEGIITYANPAARNIFGVSISKDTLLDIIFPEQGIDDFLITLVDGSTFTFQINSELRTYLFIVKGIPDSKIGYIYGADVTSLTQIQEDLGKSHNQLQAYAGYLQSIREEERLSIAREIHDDFSQILSALKMFTSSIIKQVESSGEKDISKIKSDITQMNIMLDKAILSVRSVLKKLRPEILEDFGLLETLKITVEEFQNTYGIKCDFICYLDTIELNKTAQLAIYRICQEALANIKSHSTANKAKLTIELVDDKYIVTINDNGQGFDESVYYKKESFGLIGMRERANACGGELIVTSKIGDGTTIKIIVPSK